MGSRRRITPRLWCYTDPVNPLIKIKNIMKEKYPVELDDFECKLISDYSILNDQLNSIVAKMSNKSGVHIIHMHLHELTEIIGWLASEANHTEDRILADELNDLCDRLELIEFKMKRANISGHVGDL